jgi:hypothetical protein
MRVESGQRAKQMLAVPKQRRASTKLAMVWMQLRAEDARVERADFPGEPARIGHVCAFAGGPCIRLPPAPMCVCCVYTPVSPYALCLCLCLVLLSCVVCGVRQCV